MYLLFKSHSLVEVTYLLIRFNKTISFLQNIKKTARNGMSKSHTSQTEKKITLRV